MKSEIIIGKKRTIFNATIQAANNLGMDIEQSSLKEGNLNLYFNGNLFSFGNRIDVFLNGEEKVEIVV